MKGTVKKVTLVDKMVGVDVLKIGFDDGQEYYMFEQYGLAEQFLEQHVEYTLRDEVVNNEFCKVINNLTQVSKISTLDKISGIKLFITGEYRNDCNIVFRDIAMNDTAKDCIVYCSKHEYDSSAKSTWANLTIVDKKQKVATVKLFDPESKSFNFVNQYIQLDLRRTKYGLQTQDVYLLEHLKSPVFPEVALGRECIMSIASEDKELFDMLKNSDLLKTLENTNINDEEVPGYEVVRLAVEMSIAREMYNLSKELNVQLLIRALVLSRLYLLNKESEYSNSLQNIMSATSYQVGKSKALLCLLEDNPKHLTGEKEMFNKIRDMAVTLAKINLTDYYLKK